MRVKVVVAVLLACVIGAVGVGVASAKAPKPPKKATPAKAAFATRFDCAKVAPASLITSLAGGYGGTYSLKPRATSKKVVDYGVQNKGGFSDCNYSQSAGWPNTPTSEGPAEVKIAYGTNALWWYKAEHTGAVQSAVHCKNAAQCVPVALTGLGDQAYQDGGYVAVRRGKVFLLVAIAAAANADRTDNVPVPDGLIVSVATALLARLPVG